MPQTKSYQLSLWLSLWLVPKEGAPIEKLQLIPRLVRQKGAPIEKLPAIHMALPMARCPRRAPQSNSYQLSLWPSLWLVSQKGVPIEYLPAIPKVIIMASAPEGCPNREIISYPYGYPYG